MHCDSCGQKINYISENIIKDYYKKIFNTKIIKNIIDYNIFQKIFSFILNVEGHEIIYTRKSRIQPNFLEYDSDGEYYWNEKEKICTICFQTGIIYSLEKQNQIPGTRNSIGYFFINDEDKKQYKKFIIEDKIQKMIMNYYLPNTYFIKYGRQEKPSEIKSNIFIIYPYKHNDKYPDSNHIFKPPNL